MCKMQVSDVEIGDSDVALVFPHRTILGVSDAYRLRYGFKRLILPTFERRFLVYMSDLRISSCRLQVY